MKSVKTKMAWVLFSCVLLTSLAVGGAGILNASKVMNQDTTQIMQLYCGEKAQQLNDPLLQIQRSVQEVSDYAIGQMDDFERFQTDSSYVTEYTNQLSSMIQNAAEHTPGAIAYYIRYNPSFTEPTSGLFYSKKEEKDPFTKQNPTNFAQYDPLDIERVGWYYIPVANGKPTWMEPYLNENIKTQMVSYCIPLVIEDTVVGVVGMDIDFKLLTHIVDDIQLYDTGYAFLVNNKANIVYHKNYRRNTPLKEIDSGLQVLATSILQQKQVKGLLEYQMLGEKRTAIYKTLENGMIFVLAADTSEINKTRNELIERIVLITIFAGIATLLFTYFITTRLAKPLIELNTAAKKVAEGDLDVVILHHSQDEIGILADSFRKTVGMLHEKINYIQGLAYRDPLTGVKSRNAYLEAVQKLESEIQTGRPEFAVIMFDINELKKINDQYGHDMGDLQIISAGKMIAKIFAHSPIYRIGGDEFIALLGGADLANYKTLLEEFQMAMMEHNSHVKKELMLIVAKGIAFFNAQSDLTYQDVFKRADLEMYHNKEELKR